ncbi:MAG: 5'-nucleotidase C-terminal domain-containing protein [Bacteroidetes bacterium]|nr:5'-nucleotidase C-terminal domain-containing protein [Bacteroidota bacterium]
MRRNWILFILAIELLISCKLPYSYQPQPYQFYKPGEDQVSIEDTTLIPYIYPYKVHLDSVMSEVLAYSAEPLEKGQPESKLGNFVADLCFQSINAGLLQSAGNISDFCVLNNGGLRSSLPSGNIILKNVYELMPFENELVVLEMSGSTVAKLLQFIANKGGVPVSNIKMKISDKKAVDVFINGIAFDSNSKYRVVTSDYLAAGGDGMNMFEESLRIEKTGLKVRDAVIKYLKLKNSAGEIIKVETDGRISK